MVMRTPDRTAKQAKQLKTWLRVFRLAPFNRDGIAPASGQMPNVASLNRSSMFVYVNSVPTLNRGPV